MNQPINKVIRAKSDGLLVRILYPQEKEKVFGSVGDNDGGSAVVVDGI